MRGIITDARDARLSVQVYSLPIDVQNIVFVSKLEKNKARHVVTCCFQVTAVLSSASLLQGHCTLWGQPWLEGACCDSPGKGLHQTKTSLFQGNPLFTNTLCSRFYYGENPFPLTGVWAQQVNGQGRGSHQSQQPRVTFFLQQQFHCW